MSFSRAQQGRYRPVVEDAWAQHCQTSGINLNDNAARGKWYKAQLMECAEVTTTKALNPVADFDKVMLHFAILTGDVYWISRLSRAAERRIDWYMTRYLDDLTYLTGKTADWNYVRAIYEQSNTLPDDIKDCPAETLLSILQMLNSHILRLCRQEGIRPMHLPSRRRHVGDALQLMRQDSVVELSPAN